MAKKYKPNGGPAWEAYVGKEVLFMVGTEIKAIGTMLPPNIEEGYVEFCPYISFNADGKTSRFDDVNPRTISLKSFSPDVEYSLEVKPSGYTKERVDVINRAASGKTLGFHVSQ